MIPASGKSGTFQFFTGVLILIEIRTGEIVGAQYVTGQGEKLTKDRKAKDGKASRRSSLLSKN